MSVKVSPRAGERLITTFRGRVLQEDVPYRTFARASEQISDDHEMVDHVFDLPGELHSPEHVFDRLRWGGQFIGISKDANEIKSRAQQFDIGNGFLLDNEHAHFKRGLPFFSTKFHYFIARKVHLIQPGASTRRFTFNVRLVKPKNGDEGYVVRKQVPDYKTIFRRLREKFPNADTDILSKRSQKLCERVFPVFLSREAAFLQLLQRDLPKPYKRRVPSVLGVEKGSDGLVRKLYLKWLRQGCEPLPHLEFARQSADMLRVLHDLANVIHLDLRLDNFVITRDGVGFVDFGSAVRVGENLTENPMLRSLFDEMMSTSKIQRALGKMVETGRVTSSYIASSHQKIDKAIDLFYLAIQMKKPLSNPDFIGLVNFNAESEVSKRLSGLTAAILRPKDPKRAKFISAADVVRGINRIEKKILQKAGRL